MCCKSFWKRIVSFALALVLSIFVTNFLEKNCYRGENQESVKPIIVNSYFDDGMAVGSYTKSETIKVSRSGTNNLLIVEKHIAKYTDDARRNSIEGTITLKVQFLPNGEIGKIKVVKGLPYGLTEQAIASARGIKFEPATIKGKAITVTKIVNYSFMIL